jgi:hypothetical protein
MTIKSRFFTGTQVTLRTRPQSSILESTKKASVAMNLLLRYGRWLHKAQSGAVKVTEDILLDVVEVIKLVGLIRESLPSLQGITSPGPRSNATNSAKMQINWRPSHLTFQSLKTTRGFVQGIQTRMGKKEGLLRCGAGSGGSPPNTADIGLETLGVALIERGFIKVDERMENRRCRELRHRRRGWRADACPQGDPRGQGGGRGHRRS